MTPDRQQPTLNPTQPTTIFIHGAGSSRDFWHSQYDAFPEAHFLNLPGHGRQIQSPGSRVQNPESTEETRDFGPETRDSIEEYAEWVARYVEAEGPTGVVLNGHSMGGAITLTLALQRPRWLSGIVLTGTGARLRVMPRLLELLRVDYPAAVDLIVEESFGHPSRPLTYAERAQRNGVRRQLLRTPQAVTLADYEACDRFDVMQRVAEINVPTLCIMGAQDRMTPPKYSEYLHTQIESSRLETIEGAGHMLPIEKPEEYNRRVWQFLYGLA